jgi:hypothetical protein
MLADAEKNKNGKKYKTETGKNSETLPSIWNRAEARATNFADCHCIDSVGLRWW